MEGLRLVAGETELNRELCVLSWIQLLVESTGQHDVSLITGQCVGFLQVSAPWLLAQMEEAL